MQRYIATRLLSAIPVLILVVVFVFALLRLAPGDPAQLIAGEQASPEQMQAIRVSLDLDKPVPVQFFTWVGKLVRGDLGESVGSRVPVSEIIMQRLTPTVVVAIVSEVFAVVVGVPLGVLAAWKSNTWIDRAVILFASIGFAMPVFWLAFLSIWLFSLNLGILPVLGYTSLDNGLASYARHLVLPCVTLGISLVALIARMTRSTMLEVMRQDYIRTARSKGLTEQVVVLRHALKNASMPILTVIGLGVAALLNGAIITETFFAIPGLGALIAQSILVRDYPVVQALLILATLIYVFVNMIVDLAYGYLDPRIRYT